MILNPVAAILHNTATNRWHPIFYREVPLPGPDTPGKPVRHKSIGHHTDGFATRQEAVTSAEGTAKLIVDKGQAPSVGLTLTEDQDGEWDGTSIPADVAFFQIDAQTHIARRIL